MARVLLGLPILMGLAFAPVEVPSQPKATYPPLTDPVLQELRLLRQAVERQGPTSARVELLVGRLALQDQRVARAEETVQRLDSEVSGQEQDRRRIDGEVRELARALEQETDDARRTALDQQLRRARVRHGEQMSTLGQLETRRSQAKQALVPEQRRYQELESRLSDLDRALQHIDQ